MTKRPELDETGGMKDRPTRPHDEPVTEGAPEANEQSPDPDFEVAKDGKANNKEQSGNRWWARWRS
jgi:hypothetical protein